jgi:hypothetical protein
VASQRMEGCVKHRKWDDEDLTPFTGIIDARDTPYEAEESETLGPSEEGRST